MSEPSKTAAQLLREVAAADPQGHRRRLAQGYDGSLAGCTCEWWTPPDGPNAGLPQRQLNRRNDCPVEGHNTFSSFGPVQAEVVADLVARMDRAENTATELAVEKAQLRKECDEWKTRAEQAEARLVEIYADADWLEQAFRVRDADPLSDWRGGIAWMIDRLRNMRADREKQGG